MLAPESWFILCEAWMSGCVWPTGASVWGSSSFFLPFFVHLDTYFDISQEEASFGFILWEPWRPVQTFNTIDSTDANRNVKVMIVSGKTFFKKNTVYPPGTMTEQIITTIHPMIDILVLKMFSKGNNWWSRGQFEESVALNVALKCPPCIAVLQA